MTGTMPDIDDLHVGIIGAATALRRYPDDVLCRVLDVASFAVDTVLRIDLQLRSAAVIFADDFVNTGRTITLFWRVIEREICMDWNGCVFQGQVGRLIFLMVGCRK